MIGHDLTQASDGALHHPLSFKDRSGRALLVAGWIGRRRVLPRET